MKTIVALTGSAGLLLLLALAAFLGAQLQKNESLRQQHERLTKASQLLREHAASLVVRTNELAAQLATAEAARQSAQAALSNALALLAEQKAKNPPDTTAAQAVLPRPYQLPVYLGSQSLGLAWAVPRNIQRDPQTGRYTCEQFISLPENTRTHLTTYVTNLIEQPVYAPPQIVEQDVYVDRGYTWVYPPHRRGREQPVNPGFGRPIPMPLPSQPSQPQPDFPPPSGGSGLYVPPRSGDPGIFVPPRVR